MKKALVTLLVVLCAIAQLLQSSRAIKGILNSDLSSGRYRIVSALRRSCGAGTKYLRRSCPVDSDSKLFMGNVLRRAGWWNVTLGRDAFSIEVGGYQECQASPVLRQTGSCSLALAGGRALKDWLIQPVKGQPDTFTIRSKNPRRGCKKMAYLGVPNDDCKAKKIQMFAKDDGSGKQHWLMVPKGKAASPKPKPKPKPPKKKPKKPKPPPTPPPAPVPTCTCEPGEFISTPCTATKDAVCTACSTTSCSSGQYVDVSACTGTTSTNGAVCTTCTASCTADEFLVTSACTGSETTNGAVCKKSMKLVFDLSIGGCIKSVSLPLAGTVDVVIDWGDGSDVESETDAGLKAYTYTTATGEVTVKISGSMTGFGSSSTIPDYDKLVGAKSFGELGITDWSGAFRGASNLVSVPSSIPSGATNMNYMFSGASSFNQDIGLWDVSSVTNMSGMFYDTSAFDQDISGWDVSSVTTCSDIIDCSNISCPHVPADFYNGTPLSCTACQQPVQCSLFNSILCI